MAVESRAAREETPPRSSDRPARISLRHRLEYAGFRLLLLLLAPLSDRGAARLGRFLGVVAFDLVRIRRKVALDNLAHAFPDWSRERRERTARQCYRNFGVTFLELARIPRFSREELAARVRPDRPEIFDRAHDLGRGAVLLSAHFGNWEMLAAAMAVSGVPTSVIVRPQRNRLVDAWITRSREKVGLRLLPIDRSLKGCLRALRNNEFVAVLADQDAGRDGVFLPFLGRPASTPPGPIRFARLARCPVILGFALRREDGTHELLLHDPVFVREDLPAEEAEREAMERTTAVTEEMIRRHPEHWFWMHRRWKTRPPNDPEESGSGTAR